MTSPALWRRGDVPGGVRGHGGAGARAAEPRPGPGHGGPAAPRRPAARGATAAAERCGPARQAHSPGWPLAQPAGPAGDWHHLGATGPAQQVLPQPHQQEEGVLRAPHHWLLHAGDVRCSGQRGGLQELCALVQEVCGGLQALWARQGPAGGWLPARAGALHLHRHPGQAPPRQGCLHRWEALQPPGDQLALQPWHPRVPPHQHRGLLDLLRVPFPAALPAGHSLLRRGGEADGGSLRAAGGQKLRAGDSHPPGADVPRGPPDVSLEPSPAPPHPRPHTQRLCQGLQRGTLPIPTPTPVPISFPTKYLLE